MGKRRDFKTLGTRQKRRRIQESVSQHRKLSAIDPSPVADPTVMPVTLSLSNQTCTTEKKQSHSDESVSESSIQFSIDDESESSSSSFGDKDSVRPILALSQNEINEPHDSEACTSSLLRLSAEDNQDKT